VGLCGDDVYLQYLNADDQYDDAEKAHGDFVASRHLQAEQWKLQQEAQSLSLPVAFKRLLTL